jgi:hypothetical protein
VVGLSEIVGVQVGTSRIEDVDGMLARWTGHGCALHAQQKQALSVQFLENLLGRLQQFTVGHEPSGDKQSLGSNVGLGR